MSNVLVTHLISLFQNNFKSNSLQTQMVKPLFFLMVSSIIAPNSTLFLQNIGKSLLTSTGIDPWKTLWKVLFGLDVNFDPSISTILRHPSPLQTPTVDEARYFAHFAAAAYCQESLSDWTCKECITTGSSVSILTILTNRTADTKGYIAINHLKFEIILALRGSCNPTNFLQDISWRFIDSPFQDGAKFHQGFYDATMSLYRQVFQILDDLTRKFQNYRIVITGHSLGGAMSILTYYFLIHNLNRRTKFALFTYGEPRIGNRVFADLINSRNILIARVVNEGDVVPHGLPESLGFVHHLTEFWTSDGITKICSKHVYEDKTCSNSLSSDNFNAEDHMNYLGVPIRLICKEDNPFRSAWAIMKG